MWSIFYPFSPPCYPGAKVVFTQAISPPRHETLTPRSIIPLAQGRTGRGCAESEEPIPKARNCRGEVPAPPPKLCGRLDRQSGATVGAVTASPHCAQRSHLGQFAGGGPHQFGVSRHLGICEPMRGRSLSRFPSAGIARRVGGLREWAATARFPLACGSPPPYHNRRKENRRLMRGCPRAPAKDAEPASASCGAPPRCKAHAATTA